MIQILRTPQELRTYRKNLGGQSVGFVPTMGALHSGHAELLRRCHQENDICILSIFVNPTQFNNSEDLQKYPRTWEADLLLAEQEKVDAIFAPEFQMMYPDNYRYQISENQISKLLCGKDRPGHFEGVLTVVMRLFQLVQPHRAYFGEKDFQQLQLIQGMVDAFFMDLEIVPVPTVREDSGLAKSSRNVRLNPEELKLAPTIYQIISQNNISDSQAKESLSKLGFQVDYVTDLKLSGRLRRFVAAKLGTVRLIDNVDIPQN